MNPGCRIYKDFVRPDPWVVEAFRGIPVANIGDCMGRIAAASTGIRPYGGRREVLGVAFTVKVPEGDNLMLHKAMDLAKPGDVIVIDAGGSTSRSIFGGLMANYCRLRGVAGLLVDGSIRDADELAAMDFPIYARGVTPNGPYKNGPGEINTPISFAGRCVTPGDIVVGDGDGIIFIKPKEALSLLEKAREVVTKEAKILETQENEGTYIRPWVDAKLQEIGCEEYIIWSGK